MYKACEGAATSVFRGRGFFVVGFDHFDEVGGAAAGVAGVFEGDVSVGLFDFLASVGFFQLDEMLHQFDVGVFVDQGGRGRPRKKERRIL